jgi:hypothetical protein
MLFDGGLLAIGNVRNVYVDSIPVRYHADYWTAENHTILHEEGENARNRMLFHWCWISISQMAILRHDHRIIRIHQPIWVIWTDSVIFCQLL